MATVVIGSDHAATELRDYLIGWMRQQNHTVISLFSNTDSEPVDYPDVAHKVAETIASNCADFGVLICGTGIGMSIAANRHQGVRAALCMTELHARLAREHNHANILCLGGRITGTELAVAILAAFLATPESSVERHVRRVEKIDL
ncbi:MAG: ribose 5-phosphate isomerase B [bacterium]|nr:ribose 5-phosphate isomerase B [bacterium]